MNIQDAITDLAAELAQGADAIVSAEIAADYGIKPEVLIARFEKQFGYPVYQHAAKVRETAANAARAAEMDGRRIAREIEREMAERQAICEFFATRNHGLGAAVTNAARDYLKEIAHA